MSSANYERFATLHVYPTPCSSAPPNSPTLQVTPVAGTLPRLSLYRQTGAFPSHDTLRQKPPTPPPRVNGGFFLPASQY